jgi:hypothetical protein
MVIFKCMVAAHEITQDFTQVLKIEGKPGNALPAKYC